MSFFKKLFGTKGKSEEIEEAIEQEIKEVQEEIEQEIEQEIKEESKQEIKEDIKEDIKEESKQGIEQFQEPVKTQEVPKTEDKKIEMPKVEVPKAEEIAQIEKKSFVKKLFSGLSKTRDNILKGVDEVLSTFKRIDEELYEELEEALIMADFGVDTTLHIMESLREHVKANKITEPKELKQALQNIITHLLISQPIDELIAEKRPTVILVIGVNGAGKTTSIGKLAHLLTQNNKKVLLAAADTFRAAAINQLQVWADRAGVELIKHEEGSDAAAVVYDAISAAKSRKSDVLICDTAGRLQNKVNLMKELEKINRIIEREYPEAKREILIVLDATTGQNALQQVKLFKEVADISGIILTKLDGTAKGGAIVGIYSSLKVPVKYIGVGETIEDLQPFDAEAFAKALFEIE